MSNWARKIRRRGNYLRLIEGALASRPDLFPRGEVRLATVEHDGWCKIWEGGACNCNPVLRLRPPGGGLAEHKPSRPSVN